MSAWMPIVVAAVFVLTEFWVGAVFRPARPDFGAVHAALVQLQSSSAPRETTQ